jgi:hypothetical protein
VLECHEELAAVPPSSYGYRIIEAIRPRLEAWMNRGWNPKFHQSQVLTGHGCFIEYLHRIGREATEASHECGADWGTVQHT